MSESALRDGVVLLGFALFVTAIACSYWQRATDAPLLEFVLGVMAFAYAGLLGVYFTAVFTTRGSSLSVRLALVAGFVTVLALQPAIAESIGLPAALAQIAFPWQLLIGTGVAFIVCLCGSPAVATIRETTVHA